jgi:hypothetical protein
MTNDTSTNNVPNTTDPMEDLQYLLITNGHWYNQQKGEKPTEDDRKGMIKQIEGVNKIFEENPEGSILQEKLRNDPSLPRILWELNGKIDRYNRNISDHPLPKSQSEVEKNLSNRKLPGLKTEVQQFLQGYQNALNAAQYAAVNG